MTSIVALLCARVQKIFPAGCINKNRPVSCISSFRREKSNILWLIAAMLATVEVPLTGRGYVRAQTLGVTLFPIIKVMSSTKKKLKKKSFFLGGGGGETLKRKSFIFQSKVPCSSISDYITLFYTAFGNGKFASGRTYSQHIIYFLKGLLSTKYKPQK